MKIEDYRDSYIFISKKQSYGSCYGIYKNKYDTIEKSMTVKEKQINKLTKSNEIIPIVNKFNNPKVLFYDIPYISIGNYFIIIECSITNKEYTVEITDKNFDIILNETTLENKSLLGDFYIFFDCLDKKYVLIKEGSSHEQTYFKEYKEYKKLNEERENKITDLIGKAVSRSLDYGDIIYETTELEDLYGKTKGFSNSTLYYVGHKYITLFRKYRNRYIKEPYKKHIFIQSYKENNEDSYRIVFFDVIPDYNEKANYRYKMEHILSSLEKDILLSNHSKTKLNYGYTKYIYYTMADTKEESIKLSQEIKPFGKGNLTEKEYKDVQEYGAYRNKQSMVLPKLDEKYMKYALIQNYDRHIRRIT